VLQPSPETEDLLSSAAEATEQIESASRVLNGSCSADDHSLTNHHTFPSLQRCDVCNKFLWGILRQGCCCHGEPSRQFSFVMFT